MAKIETYDKFLELDSISKIKSKFQETLVSTNRSYDFFVDWEKVKKNIGAIQIELSLLDSLLGSADIRNDFLNLLGKYPEVVKVLPIILAVRELSFDVIETFDRAELEVIRYSFKHKSGTKLTKDEVYLYWNLISKSGATQLFNTIKSFKDYVLGVEVGMDTNARKNRSGKSMETILMPYMEEIKIKRGLKLFSQQNFVSIQSEVSKTFPDLVQNKKFDFLFVKDGKPFNIEVNYFAGNGSKQEIVNSYIDRQAKLRSVSGGFALITDGQGWNHNITNELDSGLESLDYILNLSFVRKGFLDFALKEFYK